MTAARAFGVEGVNGAAFERGNRVFDKTRFIQSVCMNCNLRVGVFGHV